MLQPVQLILDIDRLKCGSDFAQVAIMHPITGTSAKGRVIELF